MRSAAKEEQQQVVLFFFNQSLHSSPVMSVMFADREFRCAAQDAAVKEGASAFSHFSFFLIFLG